MKLREVFASSEWLEIKKLLHEMLKECYRKLERAKSYDDVLRVQGSIEMIKTVLRLPITAPEENPFDLDKVKRAVDKFDKQLDKELSRLIEEDVDDAGRANEPKP